ncbi:MAG: tetratricopeptide repeat protein [Roseofilum sp. Belize BBD 4]|uniref:tetratricopeptide repeat protein n=1 Tax=Roseofilum sp. Belize BBD 4 TaxID=2821500 RepID=UPI001B16A52A|nr:tetratricopeptide repeat protein [Roseofilum sp. Belize BBD 4]MBP0034337.1 tetratricopeptide repeat protein [Roseofilum sp. Belize BBD 4]
MSTEELLKQGFTYHQQGQYAQAEEVYGQIVQQEPENTNVLCLLGMVARGQGKLEEAIAHYESAIALKPDFIEARFNLGNALSASERTEEAIACYQLLLELQPNHAGAYSNLGLLYHQQNQIAEAKQALEQAIVIDPNQVESFYNLGNLYKAEQECDRAIAYYQQALHLNPNFPQALLNLGNTLQQQEKVTGINVKRRQEAIAYYKRATEVNPNYTEAYYTLGHALIQQGHIAEAILAYQKGLKLDSEEPKAHTGLAFALLSLGFLEQGFSEYEWRWKTEEFTTGNLTQPSWNGEPLVGKTLMLYSEQGLGDMIQMIRYLPWVKEQGAKIILECRPPLKRLFATLPHLEQIVTREETLPPFDEQASLMSLPHLSKTSLNTIPAPLPFTLPDLPENLILPESTAKLKVGLAWQGNTEHPNNYLRSCLFSDLLPLFNCDNVCFHSLQKELSEGDRQQLQQTPIQVFNPNCDDFLDTAHIIRQLDLVITVDTAIAHLSATLGKPTWILLHFSCDWRWMFLRVDSPWYSTVRLFRQTQPGDWFTVMAQVQQALVSIQN